MVTQSKSMEVGSTPSAIPESLIEAMMVYGSDFNLPGYRERREKLVAAIEEYAARRLRDLSEDEMYVIAMKHAKCNWTDHYPQSIESVIKDTVAALSKALGQSGGTK